jgi:hypothetical protein
LKENGIQYSRLPEIRTRTVNRTVSRTVSRHRLEQFRTVRRTTISPEQAVAIISVTASALSIASNLIKIREWYNSQKKKKRKGNRIRIETKKGVVELTAENIKDFKFMEKKSRKRKTQKKRRDSK